MRGFKLGRINYSVDTDPYTTSRAMAYEVHISPKHAVEICREIKKRKAVDAKQYLEEVIDMKRAVPFKRHKRDIGHRKGLEGWDAGRYPQKAAREILKLIRDAESNAEYKGLDPERMLVVHAAAHKGRVIRGMMPRAMGRTTPKNTETVTIELILEES
jgi:large subunit ribosomal protein L22